LLKGNRLGAVVAGVDIAWAAPSRGLAGFRLRHASQHRLGWSGNAGVQEGEQVLVLMPGCLLLQPAPHTGRAGCLTEVGYSPETTSSSLGRVKHRHRGGAG
jgi:hypothetical protein